MKKRIILVASLAAVPASAGDIWKVAEGVNGSTKGSWNVSIVGSEVTGIAEMHGPTGASLKYGVSGKFDNGVYTAQRVSPSDRVACSYRGTKRFDGVISGSALCGAQTGPWVATPAKQ